MLLCCSLFFGRLNSTRECSYPFCNNLSSLFHFLPGFLNELSPVYTAERHVHNHGRVRVHQGAEAEGREAQPGDRLRPERAPTDLLRPDGIHE
jgi:hypothetical protein